MKLPKIKKNSRLKITLGISFIVVIILLVNLGKIQLFRSEELKKGALEQWTKSITISPKRGNIYDRMGKKLGISVNSFTVWSTNSEMADEDLDKISETISKILDLDKEEVHEKLSVKDGTKRIKQFAPHEEVNELKSEQIPGLTFVEDTKRYYPNGNFAPYILGFTDIDNKGLDGIEYIYDDYLTGEPGKYIRMTDPGNRQLPYDAEKRHDPKDGLSVVLTIDETIQDSARKVAEKALEKTKANNVSVLMMDVDTAEVLAMVSKPGFNPNNPREPLDEKMRADWKELSQEELQEEWYKLWRNPTISDIYEPGSTFKIITAAAALEENATNMNKNYYCNGTTTIDRQTLKCDKWYDPHKDQTLRQAMNNSCNMAFIEMGQDLGREKLYKYIKAFGFGSKTNIDLLGEQVGIIPYGSGSIKDVKLATLSYGHGIAVTPIQLIMAVSAIANGGDLKEPRLVKEIIDSNGEVIKKFESNTVRKVISKKTSEQVLDLMETVVSEGTGSNASIPGYKIGGKTGTAEKVIDGGYDKGKYMSSFVSVAPADNPKIAMLVLVDEPKGSIYGGTVAAPIAHDIYEETFEYLHMMPSFEDEKKNEEANQVEVPDVRGNSIEEAGRTLKKSGLKHTIEKLDIDNEAVVLDQIPLPDKKVTKGSIINLFIDSKPNEDE